jgi:hypothetical protein
MLGCIAVTFAKQEHGAKAMNWPITVRYPLRREYAVKKIRELSAVV